MAIDAVNKNETILKDYEMKLLALDGQCSGDMVLKAFIDYIRLPHFNRMVGILGNFLLISFAIFISNQNMKLINLILDFNELSGTPEYCILIK